MNRMNKVARAARGFGLAAIMLTVVVTSATAQDAKAITMRLSTASFNDAQHEWMKRFAVAIDKNTNGRIKPELFPASQLGSIPRQIEGTQQGSIQAWLGPPEFLVGVDRRFEILGAPGLFQNDKEAFKVFDDAAVQQGVSRNRHQQGVGGAALFFTGPAAYNMRVPMHHLADLKGRKIRVLASQFQTEPLSRLGATGVPMTLGDVLPALQQGTIDGAYGAVSVFDALKYYDAAKYMVETRHAYFYSVAMLSKRWYDGTAGRSAGADHGDQQADCRRGPALVAGIPRPVARRVDRERRRDGDAARGRVQGVETRSSPASATTSSRTSPT